MKKSSFLFSLLLVFSTQHIKAGFCNDSQINHQKFQDGHMDADFDDDSITDQDETGTTENLNQKSLDESKTYAPRTTKGIIYVTVHYIDNISDNKFNEVVDRARKSIADSKKLDGEFNNNQLIAAVTKSMTENKRQSDKFIKDMNVYRIETSSRDIVLDEYPATADCGDDANGDKDGNPPKYCYAISVNNRKSKDIKNIEINAETIWQGSMLDHDIDVDDYHVNAKNTETVWLYRGIPADANGNKRIFFFEITVAINPELLNK